MRSSWADKAHGTPGTWDTLCKFAIFYCHLRYSVIKSWGSWTPLKSFQFSSVAQSCPALCEPMNCSTPGLPVRHQHPWWRLMSIESVMPSNHLILCRPLLLPPSIFPSIRVFYSESVLCIRWPKYWSFSFSISPSNEYSGLISFRMKSFRQGDW